MKFSPTKLEGVWIVEMDHHHDERGWFARTWCSKMMSSHGLKINLSQCSISANKRRGTLRGMHYQAKPHAETKLVRCIRGSMFDVVLDLRPQSQTFKQWIGVELSADNGRALYIAHGCAHGFQTLEDGVEVLYMIAGELHPESARGTRWNDPQFGIAWPLPDIAFMSQRDAQYPDFSC